MTRTDPTPYRTLAASGDAELVVERSRFLAYAHPIASLDEAMADSGALGGGSGRISVHNPITARRAREGRGA